jgi:hypothetical protein
MNIFKDGVLVDVTVSFWSGSKALTADDLGLKEADVAEAFKLGKKMLVPAEVIRQFRAIESRARFAVEKGSFKFPIGNARFIPKKKFPAVLKKLKKCQFEYIQLTEQLVVNYEGYREEMIPIYQEAAETAYIKSQPAQKEFNIDDEEDEKGHFINNFLMRISAFYPTAESLRSRFSLTWDVYEIALPRMKKADPQVVSDIQEKKDIAMDEYRDQAHEKIGAFLDDVVKTMRTETLEVCNRVMERIQKGSVIKGRTLSSLKDFIENFKELNFVGDEVIEDQLASLEREFLNEHTSEQISKEVDLQTELKRRLGELAEVASNITDINSVTGGYRRKISWEEE